MLPANLESEFDFAVANLNPDHFRHLDDAGVSFEAICRTGYVGVERIATTGRLYMPAPDGFPVLIMAIWSPAPPSIYCAVEDPEIVDLIALRTDDRGRWWYRLGEPGLVLGSDNLDLAHTEGWSISLHRAPLDWLRAGCRGACLLDHCEAQWAAERFAEDEAALQAWWGTAA